MQRPSWLRFAWPPSAPVAAGVGTTVVAIGVVAALIAMPDEPPTATLPDPTATRSPSPSPTSTPAPTPSPTATPEPTPVPTAQAQATCPLNGLPIRNPRLLRHPPLAVQIENHPEARPARNLGLADLVVEATVEGDVTRYTGIYLCRKVAGLTGPVRSGRYYLIDLWQDVRVLPYMFGAGGETVRRYNRAGMPFVNGISGRWPFFQRYGTAAAPHNLYTDLRAVRRAFRTDDRLRERAEDVGRLRPPFRFGRQPIPRGRPVRHVEIWTNDYWHFGWTWDARQRRWERSEAGLRHVDAGTREVLNARSVVVQLVREDVVYLSTDPGGFPRRYHHLLGNGRGVLYVNGRAIGLHWRRPTAHDRTTWRYAETGRRFRLPPGVVWWEILPRHARLVETPR
jgi:hypothetical protein